MNKRRAEGEAEGASQRAGGYVEQPTAMSNNAPQKATAAQMASRKIAQAKSTARSARSSRANTPTANPFGGGPTQNQNPPSQSMSFNMPGSNSGFSFSAGGSAPSFGQNGASSAEAPSNPFGSMNNSATPQNNGTGGFQFGATNTGFGTGSVFGGSNTAQPQQNGTSTNPFGQTQDSANKTPSFGGFGQNQSSSTSFTGFGQNPTQPQQNGLSAGNNNNSFGSSFGQPKQNSQPSFGFGASQSQPQTTSSTPSTSFGGFGQSQQNGGSSLFNTNKPEDKSANSAGAGLFGNTSSQSQSQANGDKPAGLFGATSQSAPTPKPATSSNLFGQQNTGTPSHQSSTPTPSTQPATGLFGSSQPPQPSSTPNLGNSILGGLNQNRASEVKPGMFTSNSGSSTPKPASSNLFQPAQPSQQSADPAAGASASQSTNLFGSVSQTPTTNGATSNLFSASKPQQQSSQLNGGGSTSTGGTASLFQSQQQIPKAANLFSFGSNNAQQAPRQPPAASNLTSDEAREDTSMASPNATPHKAAATAPANGASSFSAPTQSTGDGAQDSQKQNSVLFNFAPSAKPAQGNGPQDSQKQNSVLFNYAPSAKRAQETPLSAGQTSNNLFGRITRDTDSSSSVEPAAPAPSASASALSAAKQASSAQTTSHLTSITSAAKTMGGDLSQAQKDKFKFLNEGLKGHLERQDPSLDWSPIFRYYLAKAAEIRGTKPSSSAGLSNTAAATQAAGAGNALPKGFRFGKAAETTTPMKPFGSNTFSQPPNTAPANSQKRSVDDDAQQPPATEKRATSTESAAYPKLPSTASKTAKLFESVYESGRSGSPAKSTPTFTASTPAEQPETGSTTEIPKFGASATPATAFKPTGFNPTGTSSSAPTFAAPSAGGGGFLAAFGQKATAQVESDKKKRKAEDYDSDEDNEAEWEEKDRAEQEAKKQKLMAAGKTSGGFVLSASTSDGAGTTAKSPFSFTSQTPKPAASGNLFDRITRDAPATEQPAKTQTFDFAKTGGAGKSTSGTSNLFGTLEKSATTSSNLFSGDGMSPSTGSNMFSHLHQKSTASETDKTEGEKEQGSGDHTWNPNTPVKFGGSSAAATQSFTPATAPPKNAPFGNLFGAPANTSSTNHLSVPGAKPSPNFTFGGASTSMATSLATSRATTPGGITTDGEGASSTGGNEAEGSSSNANNDDGDAAPAEKQMEDQTALRDEEKEHEDLLLSVPVAKCSKLVDDKKDPSTGELKPGWADRGKGPLYILKHRDTGKTRVILKVQPLGRAAMNFEPLKGMEYSAANAGGKSVKGPFFDYLDAKDKEAGKVSTWLIQVKEPATAAEIMRLLNEGRPS